MTSTLLNIRRTARAAALLTLALAAFTSSARAQSTAAPAAQETPPPPAAPRSVTVPKPVERTLPNGLRVVVVEDRDMPLVSAQLIVKSGSEVDPANLSGVADMTASLLTKGTKMRTAPQIASEIESLGGTLTSGAGWDASRATLNVMSSKLARAMAVMADVVRNPVFADEEIERLRQQYADGLAVSMQDPGTLAGYVASRVVFGDAPYGHPVSGTPESIPAIKRDDILKVHSTYYRPDNALLVIGGDMSAAEAFRIAESVFGDWAKPSAALPATGTANANANAKPRVVVIDMPEAGQAAVVLARRGLARTDPEYFRGIVSNAVLSGYSGRLNQEIRIKRGLSYGARSSLDVRRETGPFVASAQTKNPSGAEVAGLLVGEIGRLANEPIVETELNPRKSVLIGGFGRSLETTEGLVGQIASLALYGLSLGEINNYIGSVQAVTAADIQKFAAARLGAKEANIVIVGNARDFVEPLRKQFPDVEVIPFAELDLNNATLRKTPAQKSSAGN